MGFLDRLGLRRPPLVTELAAPRPSPSVVERDRDLGTFGGPTSPFAVDRLSSMRTLLSTSRLTPRYINDMRRHHQVSAALLVQSLPIIGAEWAIECDDDDTRDLLTAALDPIMSPLMRSNARATWAGYSPNVLVWDINRDGMLTPVKVRDLDPFTCRPIVDKSGAYEGFVQNAGTDSEVEVPALESFWLTEGLESGNLYGRSLLEAAFAPWRDQQVVNLYHLRYLERFGEPVVVARVPEGYSVANELEILQAEQWNTEHPDNLRPVPEAQVVDNRVYGLNIAEGLRHHSQVALPSSIVPNADGKALGFSWALEYLEAARRAGDEFSAKIAEEDKAIARAIFIPDLLMGDGGGIGSYALGQTHRDVWGLQVENRLTDYAGQLSTHLVQRVATINFGENAPPARLVFAPVRDITEGLWTLVTGLVERGELPVDALAIANDLGIPVPDDADDLIAAAAQAAAVQAPPAEEDLARVRERVTLAMPADTAGVPEYKVPQAIDPPAYRREPNARERRVNFRGLEDGLNGAEAATVDKLEQLLEASRTRVLRQLAGILGKGGTVAEVVGAFGSINVGNPGPYTDAWIDLQRTLWSLGLSSVATELGVDGVPDKPGRDGDALIRALAGNAAARVTGQLATMVVDTVIAVYRSGVSQAGIAAAVSDLYDREIRNEGRGPRLTTRTLAARAVNEGRADAIQRGGIPLRGAQYSALMDRRTCELCERLDEQLIGIGDLDYAKFTPPVHHNCRCVWVFVTMEEADFTPNWSGAPAGMVERFGGFVIT